MLGGGLLPDDKDRLRHQVERAYTGLPLTLLALARAKNGGGIFSRRRLPCAPA